MNVVEHSDNMVCLFKSAVLRKVKYAKKPLGRCPASCLIKAELSYPYLIFRMDKLATEKTNVFSAVISTFIFTPCVRGNPHES